MSDAEPFAVVVLGMHRCGTSAVARALPALGVPLGNDLLPPSPANPKGYWEDLESFALNEELLRHHRSSYDRFGPLLAAADADPILSALQTRAVDLIHRRIFQHGGRWAFKDPRTARLLWFWRPAIASSGVGARYVVALRNPLSAALSFEKREGVPVEKGCLLWLEHMVPAVLDSGNGPRAVIDYDLLLDEPAKQLRRMASLLGLHLSDENNDRITEYADQFLDKGLRHAKFTACHLRLDCRVPQDVVTAYNLLLQTARGELSVDAPEVLDAFTGIRQRLHSYSPAFRYMNALEERTRVLDFAVGERDAQIISLGQSNERQNLEITSLKKEVSDRDAHVAAVDQVILAERKAHIASLQQAMVARDSQSAYLSQSLVGQNKHMMLLERTAAEQTAQVASLRAMLAELEGELAHARARELDLRRSMSWRIAAPLRWVYELGLITRNALKANRRSPAGVENRR